MKLIYQVDDKPKGGKLIVFALQQLLAIMSATLLVPIIIGNGMDPAAALFGAGVGTIVYVLFTKRKSPVFLGSSFAFLGSMSAAFAGGVSMAVGYFGLILGAILAGLVYVIIAFVVKVCGVAWIDKLMPAVIIGPTVAIIGLSLAANAVGNLSSPLGSADTEISVDNEYEVKLTQTEMNGRTVDDINRLYVLAKSGVDPDKVVGFNALEAGEHENVNHVIFSEETKENDEGKDEKVYTFKVKATVKEAQPSALNGYLCLICGLLTLAVTMICSVFGKKTMKLIPFIIGILAGYALALIFTIIGKAADNSALVIIDLSNFTNLTKDGVGLATFLTLPGFSFVKAFDAFSEEITGAYFLQILAAYVPVAFVVFAEHLADHKNISSIIEKDLLKEPGLHRTLLGDGVGSMAGAFFGGCPNTTYGESIGCVAITGNASVLTIFTAAIMAMVVSFLSPFVAFLSSVPNCVIGGVCMALYGFIAVSGLKMLSGIDLGENRNLFVVSVILIAGIGGLTLSFGQVTITAIACALILGILTNLILKDRPKKEEAAPEEAKAEE